MNIDRYIRCAIATAVLMAAAMLPSCGRDDSRNLAVPAQSGVSVGFRISLGELGDRTTRAGGYDDGRSTEFENYIDFLGSDYCVMFFDTDNRYLATFRPTDLIPIEDMFNSKYYEAIGKIDWTSSESFPSDFKVVIMANWRHSYPSAPVKGQTTIGDICTSVESRYDYVAPFVLSTDNTIPMYGVKRYEGVSFTPDMLTYLGTICMLRAMAKVEVDFPDNGKDWTIESVDLHRYNRVGFCAPDKVYDESEYVKGNYDGDYVDEIHIVGDAASDGRLPFRRIADGRYIIYVPEYRNTADGKSRADDAAEIVVKFEERQDKEYTIDFKYYENPPEDCAVGDPFDIRRNYYYRFSISKSIEYDEDLKISIDVDPYDIYDLGPVFGVDK